MKIVVFCNHPLAFGTIEMLLGQNHLAGLVVPNMMNDTAFRVKMLSDQKKLPFLAVDQETIEEDLDDFLKKIKPDIAFVITFPYKIPDSVLKIPRGGFFNWHTGLLPQYRGPDPIFWEIANQEEYGGICVHRMTSQLDAGPVYRCERVQILPEDTYGQHIQKLAGAAKGCTEAMMKELLENKKLPPTQEQDKSQAGYNSRPEFTDLVIDWDKQSSGSIKALVRAANPIYLGAIGFFRGVPIHFLQVAVGSTQNPPKAKPGTILSADSKNGLIVYCKDGKLLKAESVLSHEDGYFTGAKLATTFQIKPGEQFTGPPNG